MGIGAATPGCSCGLVCCDGGRGACGAGRPFGLPPDGSCCTIGGGIVACSAARLPVLAYCSAILS